MKTTINNNKVIIINGFAKSGKDEFVKQSQMLNHKVMNFSSVSKVKDIARYCGWEGTKTEKDRKFLSDLKDILTEWDDLPFKSINEYINACKNKVIFIHSREPKEIDRLEKEFNATTLLIKNDRIKPIISNHADAYVENYNYDCIIYNNGTIDNLKESAEIYLKYIEKDEEEGSIKDWIIKKTNNYKNV